MALWNSHFAYGSVSRVLHWMVAVLLLIMLSGGFFMDAIADTALKATVINAHKLIGIAILVLMLVRLLWRLCNIQPDLKPNRPRWQRVAARWVHRLLYTLVILMPLSGWVMSTAAGRFPHLGSWSLPLPFIVASQEVSQLFFSCHQTIAWLIIGLLVLHIAAAIKQIYD